MAFVTWEDTTSDGSQTTYNVIFPFLSRDHLTLYYNSVAQPTTAFTWLSDGQISLVSPASNGVTVRVARDTPQTVLTDFQDGVIVGEADLDNSYLQNLYIEQELQDKWDEAVAAAITVSSADPQNNLVATVAPAVGDDTADGYAVGSLWLNTTTRILYIASDVTLGAAVWNEVQLKIEVQAGDPGVNDDITSGYRVGSIIWATGTSKFFICSDNTDGAAVWVDTSNALSYPLTHSGLVLDNKSAGIASATTTDLSTLNGNYVVISGSTTITGFGTVAAGTLVHAYFSGAPLLTHHTTQLRCPGLVNLQLVAGSRVTLRSDGSGNWTVMNAVPVVNMPQADGTTWDYLRTDGAGQLEWHGWTYSGAITLSTGSPTSVTLDDSLEGVSEIEIYLAAASTDTANQAPMIQIGDSGGLETSAYSGGGFRHTNASDNQSANSNGFLLGYEPNFDAAITGSFMIRLVHMGSNVWTMEAHGGEDAADFHLRANGIKTLSGALDRVALTTSGGAAVFDGGTAFMRSR